MLTHETEDVSVMWNIEMTQIN